MNGRGHSLVELMIALALSALVSLGALTLYAQQSGLERREADNLAARREAAYLHDTLASLIRLAEEDGIVIHQPTRPPRPDAPEGNDDRLTIDLRLPRGIPLWPAPDGRTPWIRLHWSAHDGRLLLRRGSKQDRLDNAPATPLPLAPGLKLVDLDLWPLTSPEQLQPRPHDPPRAGYLLAVSVIADDPGRPQTVSGIVGPRN